MNQLSKVSVVIPVYNGEKYVEKAIKSALDQENVLVEVIAVNDGSPDGSLQILKSYDPRITIVDQPNSGVAIARNSGMKVSTGDFIAFLDQDDYWHSSKLALQVSQFQHKPNVGLIHTGVEHIDAESGSSIPPLNPNSRPDQLIGNCTSKLLLNNAIYNSSVMIRREVLEKVGFCDTTITGNTVTDLDLWIRISREYELDFIDEKLTYYRTHSEQGLMDRRSMLGAELELLKKIPVTQDWDSEEARNQKLSQVCDELAVAHLDAGEKNQARKYFLQSYRHKRNQRSGVCFAATYLPDFLLSRIRNHAS